MNTIRSFCGENSFLSNFAPSPFEVQGLKWGTNEHFFQAQKAKNRADFNDILRAETPGKAKRLSRKIVIKQDWEFVKTSVMLEGVRHKFGQNPDLAKKLINTGTSGLIEGNNWHDNFWGVCDCPKCASIPAENMLGEILMLVREELRA